MSEGCIGGWSTTTNYMSEGCIGGWSTTTTTNYMSEGCIGGWSTTTNYMSEATGNGNPSPKPQLLKAISTAWSECSDTPPYRGPGPNHGVFIRGSRPSDPPGWGVAAPQNFPYIRIKCWDCSGMKTGHQKHPDQIWLEVESSTNHPDPNQTHTNQKTYRNSRTLPLPKPTPPPTFNLYPRLFRPLGCAPEALKSNENGYGCETQGPCPHLIGVCISIKHMLAYRALYVLLLVQRLGEVMNRMLLWRRNGSRSRVRFQA